MDEKKLENLLDQLQMQLSHLTARVENLENSIARIYKSSANEAERLSRVEGHLFKTEFDLIGAISATKLLEVDIQTLNNSLAKIKESAKSSL